jgi:CubicO group peptidase (beta-lactamase class C family)
MSFDAARQILRDAIARQTFPAAVVEVGHERGPVWREAFGHLTYDPEAGSCTQATIFDLASLTKVIATTTVVMRLVDDGVLCLDDRVGEWLADWKGKDREHVTLRDLLAHCSGLSAHLPLYESYSGRMEFQRVICGLALEYTPRTQSIYSDMGFMLLGWIAEDAGGAPLSAQHAPIAQLVAPEFIGFSPPRTWRTHIAPTEIDTWRGRLLIGEVHDPNCWALSGEAGHAGLFGSASATGGFAQFVLRGLTQRDASLAHPETLKQFAHRTEIPESTRALGWDTMRPTSSCGSRMNVTAIGHTGYTGTSLWIDWERRLYVVLLTNRVHPTATNNAILQVRPAFHDAVVTAWIDGSGPAQSSIA